MSTDSDEVADAERTVRDHLALYIGGMGARGKNFYASLAARYGFADAVAHVQELYLSGQKIAASAAIPDELVHGTALIGDPDHVAGRVEAFRAAGVSTLNATPIARTAEARLRDVAHLTSLTS